MKSLLFLLLLFHTTIAFVQKSEQHYSKKELSLQLKENEISLYQLKNQVIDLSMQVNQLRHELTQVKDSLEHYKKQLEKISSKDETNDSTKLKSTTVRGTNYFGTGGSGGETGSKEGTGGCSGSERVGNTRVRLNNISAPSYNIDVDCIIALKLTINSEGIVTDCHLMKSVTTCTNQTIINDVIRLVKQQVRFNKDPGSPLVQADYIIKLNAR